MRRLENYGVEKLNSKEIQTITGGWSFLMPWKLGYLFVDYPDRFDKLAFPPTNA